MRGNLDKLHSRARRHGNNSAANPFGRRSTSLSKRSNPDRRAEEGFASPPNEFSNLPRPASTHSEPSATDTHQDRDGPSQPGPRRAKTMPEEKSEPSSAVSQHPPVKDLKDTDNIEEASMVPLTNCDTNMAAEGARQRKKPTLQERVSSYALGKRRRTEKEHVDPKEQAKKAKLAQKITIGSQIRAVLFPQWLTINWLLLLVPVGIAIAQVHGVPAIAVFVTNFLAIVPLAGILSFATEEIALRVGETLGGLLNASFGNAVELIVGIIALAKREIIIVQTSLIGSMLSNLLLVLGMCFFCGGINRMEQHFNIKVAHTTASLLALCVGCLIIPTAFTWGAGARGQGDERISRGTSMIMLFVYGAYLVFQLKSHKEVYNIVSAKAEKRWGIGEHLRVERHSRVERRGKDAGDSMAALAQAGASQAAHIGGEINAQRLHQEEEEDPQLSLIGALVTLACSTTLVGICSEFLVSSINEVTCQYNVSQYFVGLILLPIVGNAAEHATAVTVAIKDKMDLAIGVAVGSSMQIALLVLPLMVILSWIMGGSRDMTLVFDDFQIAVLFVSVLLVNYLIGDGKSHWMEGVLLMSLYFIIAISSWFYPTSSCGES